MAMQPLSYAQIRDHLRPGDVIAYCGNTLLSRIIRVCSGSNVSHVGVIVGAATANEEPTIVESTVLLDQTPPTFRVNITSFQRRYDGYDGGGWWLPLAPAVRARFDEGKFVDFVHKAEGQLFDVPEGVLVMLRDLYQRLSGMESQAELGPYFCSELVADAFESAGVVANVEASNVSPTDLCRWQIYADTYHYIVKPAGPNSQEISGYNTRPPGST